MSLRRPPAAAALLLLCAGCGPEAEDGGPLRVIPSRAFEATTEVLGEGPHELAAPLPGLEVLAAREGRLLRFGPGEGEPVPVQGEVGDVAAAAVFEGHALLAAETGLWTLAPGGAELRASPLTEAASDLSAHALLAEGDRLWLAGPAGLHLWRGGRLYDVGLEGFAGPAGLAWGPEVEGEPALWVAEGERLASVRPAGDGFTAELTTLPFAAARIASDAAGRLWVAGPGGFVRRLADGTWEELELVPAGEVTALVGGPDRAELYLHTTAHGALRHLHDRFVFVPGPGDGAGWAVDALGRLLVPAAEALTRISDGRPLGFLGLSGGERLEERRTVTAVPTLAGRVVAIGATLDGEPLPGSGAWTLDPLELAAGPHELAVEVTYEDLAEPVTGSLLFGVGDYEPPNWVDDIEPLFLDACGECHTPSGVSTDLTTAALWQASFEDILFNIEGGRMPLPPDPPLTEAEVALVRAWAAGGFPAEGGR